MTDPAKKPSVEGMVGEMLGEIDHQIRLHEQDVSYFGPRQNDEYSKTMADYAYSRLRPLREIRDIVEVHGLLVAENMARKKRIDELTICRDHWETSYKALAEMVSLPCCENHDPA